MIPALARWPALRRWVLLWSIGCISLVAILLATAALGSVIHRALVALAVIATMACLPLGIAAILIAQARAIPLALRLLITPGLAYHSLFGPVLAVTALVPGPSRNDAFVNVAYPHVIRWINSFE